MYFLDLLITHIIHVHCCNTQMGKSTQIDKSVTAGRIVCDTMISARELIRAKSYDLTELVTQVLRQKRDDIEPEQLKAAYRLVKNADSSY